MSEELGPSRGGARAFTALLPPPVAASSQSAASSSATPKPTPKRLPGGGSNLVTGDKPGDPFACLIVLAIDGLLTKKLYRAPETMPPAVDAALSTCVSIVKSSSRCVVVLSGGSVMPQLCMQAFVERMPGGLDSFGRGRLIEVLVKETAAEYGNLWESALLVKMVAKRQAALIRFGSVLVVTARAMAAVTRRVYQKCFEDWRVFESGGLGRGGRDLPLGVRVEAIDVDPIDEAAFVAKAASSAWFDNGKLLYAHHPSFPKSVVMRHPDWAENDKDDAHVEDAVSLTAAGTSNKKARHCRKQPGLL